MSIKNILFLTHKGFDDIESQNSLLEIELKKINHNEINKTHFDNLKNLQQDNHIFRIIRNAIVKVAVFLVLFFTPPKVVY